MDEWANSALVQLGALGLLVLFGWLVWKGQREELKAKDEIIAEKDAHIAALNKQVVDAYRETIPVLGDASRGLELVATVIPAIAATEPARIRGPK